MKRKRRGSQKKLKTIKRVDRDGLGQLKTGQGGNGLLQIHLWCPGNLPRLYGIDGWIMDG